MDTLLQHVKTAAASADEASRKKMIDDLCNLAISIESGFDSMQRIMYSQYHLLGAKLGADLKLFNILVESKDPLTVTQLAEKTGADSAFLARLLRYLSSVRQIQETGKNTFTSNNVTLALSKPAAQGGVNHYFHALGPILQESPTWFATNSYPNPSDPAKLPFQKAFSTDLPLFFYFQTRPDLVSYFAAFMAGQRGEMPNWLTVYPIASETENWDPEKPVFVDIGGGVGHICAALKEKYPELKGKVVLQDLPHEIEHAVDGVEGMVHNFFEEQPVKGAKFYYLRNIIHDYPDDKAKLILENIKTAMSEDSVILIDDMVLPDEGAHWHATEIDLTMMVALGAMERTEEQWNALIKSAGLKIKKVWTYTESLRDSVIVAVPI